MRVGAQIQFLLALSHCFHHMFSRFFGYNIIPSMADYHSITWKFVCCFFYIFYVIMTIIFRLTIILKFKKHIHKQTCLCTVLIITHKFIDFWYLVLVFIKKRSQCALKVISEMTCISYSHKFAHSVVFIFSRDF